TKPVTNWADDVINSDITTCMTNDTLDDGCIECKLNQGVRIEISACPPSSLNTLTVRFYCDDSMQLGENAMVPYTDADSVSDVNKIVIDIQAVGQWYEFVTTEAFRNQLADLGGKFAVRLISNDVIETKNKFGEAEYDAIYTTYKYEGITKDKDGTVLGSCHVALFENLGGTPPTYQFKDSQISDGVTGAYSFTGQGNFNAFVRFQKDGSPNVFDTTDNVVVGVEE
ncbi:unnamed protein product, partial [marine sediment metagenome]